MASLVASLNKLTAVHKGMARERARDIEQEDKRASLEVDLSEWKRKFEWMCELSDLRRQYRRERVRLDSKAENFATLKSFYDEEIRLIEVKISKLVYASPPDNRHNN